MRVITGSARGRQLIAPAGLDTRPTTDKVKEAICSSLQFDFPGAKVLDLFAGSGQMGIETLSRGAAQAVLLDSDSKAVQCIRKNVEVCKLQQSATVLQADAVAYLQRCREQFDIVFLDPPYRKGILTKIIPILIPFLSEMAVIVCEHEPELELSKRFSQFCLQKQKKYGKISVSIYRIPEESDNLLAECDGKETAPSRLRVQHRL